MVMSPEEESKGLSVTSEVELDPGGRSDEVRLEGTQRLGRAPWSISTVYQQQGQQRYDNGAVLRP